MLSWSVSWTIVFHFDTQASMERLLVAQWYNSPLYRCAAPAILLYKLGHSFGARPVRVNFTHCLWRTTTFSLQFMPPSHSQSAGRSLSRNWNQPPGCKQEKSAHSHWHPWDVGTCAGNGCLNPLTESVHSVYGKLIPTSTYGIAWMGKMFEWYIAVQAATVGDPGSQSPASQK